MGSACSRCDQKQDNSILIPVKTFGQPQSSNHVSYQSKENKTENKRQSIIYIAELRQQSKDAEKHTNELHVHPKDVKSKTDQVNDQTTEIQSVSSDAENLKTHKQSLISENISVMSIDRSMMSTVSAKRLHVFSDVIALPTFTDEETEAIHRTWTTIQVNLNKLGAIVFIK